MVFVSGLFFMFYICSVCETFYYYTERKTHEMIFSAFMSVMLFMITICLII